MLAHFSPRRQQGISWKQLVALEPRFAEEEQKLLAARRLSPRQFETTARSVRRRISTLVGWAAVRRDPVLRSADAYHVALDRLLNITKQSHLRPRRAG